MSVYVIEYYDRYLTQWGFSFSEEEALAKARELTEKAGDTKFFVTEYQIKNFNDVKEFGMDFEKCLYI